MIFGFRRKVHPKNEHALTGDEHQITVFERVELRKRSLDQLLVPSELELKRIARMHDLRSSDIAFNRSHLQSSFEILAHERNCDMRDFLYHQAGLYPCLYYIKHILNKSQLNGNNGEHTGLDDVKGGKEGNDERKRQAREAYTNRKRAGGSNKKNMKSGPVDVPEVKKEDIVEQNEPMEKPVKVVQHLYQNVRGCLVYYSKQCGFYSQPLPIVYLPAFGINWIQGKFDKDDSFIPYADVQEFKLLDIAPSTSFNLFGYKYKLAGEVYSPMVVEALIQSMPLPSEDVRNLRAMQAFLTKKFPGLRMDVVQSSLLVYLLHLSKIGQGSTLQPTATWEVYTPIPSQLFLRNPLEIKAATCSIPNDWNFNTRFKIGAVGGATWSLGVGTPFNVPFFEHPRFTWEGEVKERYRNVAYCKLAPSNDFQYYDVSGVNCTPALSRLLKSREGEAELFTNQLGLVNPHWFRLFEICGAKLHSEGGEYTMVTRNADKESGTGIYRFKKHPDYEFHRAVFEAQKPANTWLSFFYKAYKALVAGINLFIKAVRGFQVVTEYVKEAVIYYSYSPFYQFYDKLSWLQTVVELPSPKKPLYKSWLLSERDLPKILSNEGEFELKLKREEGKSGKASRLYGTGEHLCLVDRVLPDVLKEDDKKEINLRDVLALTKFLESPRADWDFRVKFSIAQDCDQSDILYKESINLPNKTILFVFFSDDSFMVVKDEFGTITLFEIDISSCDSSNSIAIFGYTHEMMSAYNSKSADLLIAHAARRATLKNPDDPSSCFTFLPDTFFEYSGLLLTTLLNNRGSRKIASAIYLRFLRGHDLYESVVLGARDVGYIVTCEMCSSFNKVTFLKRAFSVGAQRSWKVLGTLLRGFGVVEGGLTPETLNLSRSDFRRLSEEEKFQLLGKQRLMGEVNEPGNPVLNTLREKFGLQVTEDVITTLDLIDRYGGEIWEWEDFYVKLRDVELGFYMTHPILDLIYAKDYGVKILSPPS